MADINGTSATAVGSIVLIADDLPWTTTLAGYLAAEGFVVVVDHTGATARGPGARAADAVVVDLDLHGSSALEVCASWCRTSSAPVLAVAGTRDEATLLAAYAAGADLVARRDISPRQFLAHLRSVLRRVPRRVEVPGSDVVLPLPIELDRDRRVAIIRGTPVVLTDQEVEFLGALTTRAGRVVSRAELTAAAGLGSPSERTIDFFVRRLREKLEQVDGERRITTVRGVGFRFVVRAAADEVPI